MLSRSFPWVVHIRLRSSASVKQKDNNRPCLNYGNLWNLGSNSSFIFRIRSGSTLKILTSFDIESDSNYLTTVSFANLTLIQIDK